MLRLTRPIVVELDRETFSLGSCSRFELSDAAFGVVQRVGKRFGIPG